MLTKSDLQAIKGLFDDKFDNIDKKFDKIDKKFDKIDKRFDSIDKKFDSIDKRFDKIDKRLDVLEERVDDNTKELINLIQAGFNVYEPKQENHEIRITALESAVFPHT
jgi:archaellum component FlaC